MSHVCSLRKLTLLLLVLLGAAVPARAEDFTAVLVGQIVQEEPVKGGTQYGAVVAGNTDPFGKVEGVTSFIIRGASVEEGVLILTDENGDDLYIAGEGVFSSPTQFSGNAEVLGGTGAYKKATGELSFEGELLGAGVFTLALAGNIDL